MPPGRYQLSSCSGAVVAVGGPVGRVVGRLAHPPPRHLRQPSPDGQRAFGDQSGEHRRPGRLQFEHRLRPAGAGGDRGLGAELAGGGPPGGGKRGCVQVEAVGHVRADGGEAHPARAAQPFAGRADPDRAAGPRPPSGVRRPPVQRARPAPATARRRRSVRRRAAVHRAASAPTGWTTPRWLATCGSVTSSSSARSGPCRSRRARSRRPVASTGSRTRRRPSRVARADSSAALRAYSKATTPIEAPGGSRQASSSAANADVAEPNSATSAPVSASGSIIRASAARPAQTSGSACSSAT